MKRLFFTLLFFIPLIHIGEAHPPFYRSIQPIQYLNDDKIIVNLCTSFSIHENKGLWATAAHCVHDGDMVEGTKVRWVAVDTKKDLAVYQANSRVALHIAIKEPEIGDRVSLTGYPYGALDPVTFYGYVANPRTRFQLDSFIALYNILGLPGDSGGPILDNSGRFVGVGQQSNMAGLVRSTIFQDTREFLRPYVE